MAGKSKATSQYYTTDHEMAVHAPGLAPPLTLSLLFCRIFTTNIMSDVNSRADRRGFLVACVCTER